MTSTEREPLIKHFREKNRTVTVAYTKLDDNTLKYAAVVFRKASAGDNWNRSGHVQTARKRFKELPIIVKNMPYENLFKNMRMCVVRFGVKNVTDLPTTYNWEKNPSPTLENEDYQQKDIVRLCENCGVLMYFNSNDECEDCGWQQSRCETSKTIKEESSQTTLRVARLKFEKKTGEPLTPRKPTQHGRECTCLNCVSEKNGCSLMLY